MYMNIIYLPLYRLLTNKTYRHDITEILLKVALKAYRLSELNFFVYIKSCQYLMFILIKCSEQEASLKNML